MKPETYCGIDLDLRKLGIVVGVWDVVSMVYEIVLEYEKFKGKNILVLYRKTFPT